MYVSSITAVQAQNIRHDTYITVRFELRAFSGTKYITTFDTDSVSIDGMTKEVLEKQFSNITSPVHVLNFLSANGFDLVTILPVQSGSGMGNSSGFVGYIAFFKKE
ncbi:MAG: hypothetical protein JST27_11370 [Bacteroidetes bacterium]|nr:hypothetical protein [Bacteroidota bacterium]